MTTYITGFPISGAFTRVSPPARKGHRPNVRKFHYSIFAGNSKIIVKHILSFWPQATKLCRGQIRISTLPIKLPSKMCTINFPFLGWQVIVDCNVYTNARSNQGHVQKKYRSSANAEMVCELSYGVVAGRWEVDSRICLFILYTRRQVTWRSPVTF